MNVNFSVLYLIKFTISVSCRYSKNLFENYDQKNDDPREGVRQIYVMRLVLWESKMTKISVVIFEWVKWVALWVALGWIRVLKGWEGCSTFGSHWQV